MFKRLLYKGGLSLLFFHLGLSLAYSQTSVAVFGNFGYATVSGGEAKGYNYSLLEGLEPMSAKLLSNYPGFYMYSAKLSLFTENQNMFSLYAGHTSSGSRISYVDYSGYFYFDQRVIT